ncbi:hypothetical protein [Mangrovimonas cancribranchiae]|uniref:HTH LytTR-type domain-containing protein n=1 Tax=Mangrovimonas cancribranchiae TaxID=3080055 RepID=A0AAU6NVZ1_9FLAO
MNQNNKTELIYRTKNQIRDTVKGVLEGRFIEFCLEQEPIDMQIDLGENIIDNTLTIKSMLLENSENQMFIENRDFYLYFKNNKKLIYNSKESNYTLVKLNNKSITPLLISRSSMKARLKKRLKP